MHADCVCVCAVFEKLLSYPCQQESQCCRHGESRQLDWPLTSGVNLSLCREGFWLGIMACILVLWVFSVLKMVIREGHSKRRTFKFDPSNCQHS